MQTPCRSPPCKHCHRPPAPACYAGGYNNAACRHCRATAQDQPHPKELTTAEGLAFIDDLAGTGGANASAPKPPAPPMLILTGGEPLLRADIYELAAHAAKRGLKPVMAPNGTLLDQPAAARLKDCGILRCSISLDGPDAARHDALRGVPGAFTRPRRTT